MGNTKDRYDSSMRFLQLRADLACAREKIGGMVLNEGAMEDEIASLSKTVEDLKGALNSCEINKQAVRRANVCANERIKELEGYLEEPETCPVALSWDYSSPEMREQQDKIAALEQELSSQKHNLKHYKANTEEWRLKAKKLEVNLQDSRSTLALKEDNIKRLEMMAKNASHNQGQYIDEITRLKKVLSSRSNKLGIAIGERNTAWRRIAESRDDFADLLKRSNKLMAEKNAELENLKRENDALTKLLGIANMENLTKQSVIDEQTKSIDKMSTAMLNRGYF